MLAPVEVARRWILVVPVWAPELTFRMFGSGPRLARFCSGVFLVRPRRKLLLAKFLTIGVARTFDAKPPSGLQSGSKKDVGE
jgi:hypothetical protein